MCPVPFGLVLALALPAAAQPEKPQVAEKDFRRALFVLLEEPAHEKNQELAKLIVAFVSQTPQAAVVLGKDELKWFGDDKERALVLMAAYTGGNAQSQLNSGVKRNDRYSGLLCVFQVYRGLRAKDARFRNAEVDALLKLHREGKLQKHLESMDRKDL
jgi:hypothetical protein